MNNFIYEPQPRSSYSQQDNTYYCLSGLGDDTDQDNNSIVNQENDKRVCAKKLKRINGTTKYLIKLSEDRKLYNPISIYGSEKNKNFLESISRNQNLFKEVNNMTFNLYLRFLRTKNIAYLNQAEREI